MTLKIPWRAKPSPEPSVLPHERDHALMRDVAAGNAAAFRALFDRHKGPVLSYLLCMLPTKSIAEEIAQEVFSRVYHGRDTYAQDSRFAPWLWTIVRNLAVDALRKSTEPSAGEDLELLAETHDDDIAPDPEIEAKTIAAASSAALEFHLKELPPSQREALLLRTFSDLSPEEIAVTLAAKKPVVTKLIDQAKDSLLLDLKKGGHHG